MHMISPPSKTTTWSGSRPSSVALMLESDGPGGAERMLLHLADELRRRGHMVCPVGPANGCGWLAARFRERGFDPETFSLRRPIDPSCVRGLADTLRRRDVDVVHSHEFTMAVYGAAAARLIGKPHIVTMHGGQSFAARWRRRAAFRWAFRRSRRVVTVSAATRSALASLLGLPSERIDVIPNGVRLQPGSRDALRRELHLAPAERLIVAVGNLYPVKGHMVLLHALATLSASQNGCAWRAVIIGRGEEEARLRAFAAEGGFADRLHLLGYRDDVADVLAAADIFVMPSLSEGLPLALIEAMLASRAIIASEVGGIPEVVTQHRHALLVPPGDHAALAAALRRLLEDPAYCEVLGRAAERRARASLTVESMTDAYERIYAQ
jgi:glycosyltransferase involved in cell wall biosynthesis